jgi:hypothetical protein
MQIAGFNLAAQHGYRCGRQGILRIGAALNRRPNGRSVRIRIAVPPCRMPLILRLSKRDHGNLSGEMFVCVVSKDDAHVVSVIVVLVD